MWGFFKRMALSEKWQDRLTLISVGVILGLAVVGVVLGVVMRAGDYGLFEDKSLRWQFDDTPLTCMYDNSVTKEHLEAYETARLAYNKKTNRRLFAPCVSWIKPVHAHITFTLGSVEEDIYETPFDRDKGARVYYFKTEDGDLKSVHLVVDDTASISHREKIYMHELGHILMLKHDRTKDSVMYPHISDRPVKLSRKDIKLLRKIYNNN